MDLESRFSLGDSVGRDELGEVFRAVERGSGAGAALKRFDPWVVERQPPVDAYRHALLAHRSTQPCRAPAAAAFEVSDGVGRLVSRWVEGTTLADLLTQRESLPLDEAASLTCGVLDALSELHACGYAHGGLTPRKVLLVGGTDAGSVVLTDPFQHLLYAVDDPIKTSRTDPDRFLGLPEYFSPEQAQGERPDARSDVYVAGLLFYQMLTGKTPFAARSPSTTLKRQIYEKPLPPRYAKPGLRVPAACEETIARALSKEPGERFSSAAELHAAISALRAGPAVPATERAATPLGLRPYGVLAGEPTPDGQRVLDPLRGAGDETTALGDPLSLAFQGVPPSAAAAESTRAPAPPASRSTSDGYPTPSDAARTMVLTPDAVIATVEAARAAARSSSGSVERLPTDGGSGGHPATPHAAPGDDVDPSSSTMMLSPDVLAQALAASDGASGVDGADARHADAHAESAEKRAPGDAPEASDAAATAGGTLLMSVAEVASAMGVAAAETSRPASGADESSEADASEEDGSDSAGGASENGAAPMSKAEKRRNKKKKGKGDAGDARRGAPGAGAPGGGAHASERATYASSGRADAGAPRSVEPPVGGASSSGERKGPAHDEHDELGWFAIGEDSAALHQRAEDIDLEAPHDEHRSHNRKFRAGVAALVIVVVGGVQLFATFWGTGGEPEVAEEAAVEAAAPPPVAPPAPPPAPAAVATPADAVDGSAGLSDEAFLGLDGSADAALEGPADAGPGDEVPEQNDAGTEAAAAVAPDAGAAAAAPVRTANTPDTAASSANSARAREVLAQAQAALGRRDVDGARRLFSQTIELDESIAAAHAGLGDVEFQARNYSQAARHHRRATRLNARSPEYFNKLGMDYFRLENFPAALEAFEQAVQLGDSSAQAHADRVRQRLAE